MDFATNMIDPIHALAFSIQASKGVYALLLGSGVSRAAEIPTGWEITLDLARKLAKLCGEPCEPSPEAWYQERFGQEPDYSELLGQLAKTPSERQQLLRPYFEPNEEERAEGKKQPTGAHNAIAQLAAQGYIKVIITTNFDPLLENALTDVAPTVLSTADQIQGALPLIHMPCCLLKIHGDYRDSRIRNTPKELAAYPAEFDQFLDRIFDEFGLIVCGWSGDWDKALRNAIYRAPSRRFTTFWATRGKPSHDAQKLIDHRKAEVITIEDADSFFQTVQRHVESIEEFSKPHPLSIDAAVASLKRYLSEPKYEIPLADLISATVERVVTATSDQSFDLRQPDPTTETVTRRVRAYDAACSTLTAMAAVGGRWGEVEHSEFWQPALRRLSRSVLVSGKTDWIYLRRYPGSLLLYSLGLGAVAANRLDFLSHIFSTPVDERGQDVPATSSLAPSYTRVLQTRRFLEGMESHYLPLDWMYKALRQSFQEIIPDDSQYERAFVKLEMLIALNSIIQPKPAWMRRFIDRPFKYPDEPLQQVLQELRTSIANLGQESPFVKANIFGENPGSCSRGIDELVEWIRNSHAFI